MNELLHEPLWREQDLGLPIPDSPHAISVALPLWRHAVAYEEGDPAVCGAMALGYPRFVYHPLLRELAERGRRRFAAAGEECLPLPSRRVAERAAAFIARDGGQPVRIHDWGAHGLWALCFPAEARAAAKSFWQHSGEIVSSRQAEAALSGILPDPAAGADAALRLRRQQAELYGVAPEDCFLHPTGMAAVCAALRLLGALHPGRRSVQIGFPYVDVLKAQQRFGAGAELIAEVDGAPEMLRELLARERFGGCVVETPGNPLLRCCDLPALSELLRARGIPLLVDDTVATPFNVDVLPWADLVVSSLTKYVAGVGDVMAGVLVLNPASPHAPRLREALAADFEPLLWPADALVLAGHAADFPQRMRRINATAASVVAHLRAQPQVAELLYPDRCPHYRRLLRSGGGFGGLCSILLRDGQRSAPAFFDALRISKGPSLGTNYSLACPYTLLAHYHELEWAERCGASRWLVRLSIGLEDPADLIARLDEALQAVPTAR